MELLFGAGLGGYFLMIIILFALGILMPYYVFCIARNTRKTMKSAEAMAKSTETVANNIAKIGKMLVQMSEQAKMNEKMK